MSRPIFDPSPAAYLAAGCIMGLLLAGALTAAAVVSTLFLLFAGLEWVWVALR